MHGKVHRNSLKVDYKLHWYRIKSILGQGGFGITYLAHDFNLDEDVAIKEYLPIELAVRESDFSVHPVSEAHGGNFLKGLDGFITEARTLSKFKHPNIVRVRSVFEENNTAYMIMEYEQGDSLQDVLTNRKTLEEAELLKILIPILGGLELVHGQGFIHRDIKPANIFLRKDGSPVLLDFGSARQALGEQTKTLTSLISPGYAPFEQYYSSSSEQGPWTDIYGLAATLYRAVVGRTPQDAVDRSKAILNTNRDVFVLVQDIAKNNYSERFLKAIDHGLNFKQEQRPQTIRDWKREFEIPTQAPAMDSLGSGTGAAAPAQVSVGPEVSEAVTAPAAEGRKPDTAGVEISAAPARMDPEADRAEVAGRKAAQPPPTAKKSSVRIALLFLLFMGLVGGGYVGWLQYEKKQAAIAAALVQARLAMEAEQEHLAAQQRREQDEKHWAEAQSAHTQAAYQEYLNDWPAGAHAEAARAAIGELAGEAERLKVAELARQRAEQATREKQARIANLLQGASADIQARRLTSPQGNNAHEKYLAVLVLDPVNEAAATGINRLIEAYVGLFDTAVAANDFDKAETYLARIRGIHPDSPAIATAEQRLAGARTEQQRLAAEAQARRQVELQQKQRDEERRAKERARQVLAGEMISIRGGTFQMGANEGDSDEKPVHTVTIKPFRLGKYEVTQGQWQKVMGENPSYFEDCGANCPVEAVSWDDAQAFIQKLNAKTGGNYRLPTEAEWEYACRSGGRTETYCGGGSPAAVAWYSGNGGSETHRVGRKQANGLGLYDMSGNIWEWVEDCWHGSYSGAPTDGRAWASGGNCSRRVKRGGSWYNGAAYIRSANRNWNDRTVRDSNLGFRLAQDK